MTRHSASRLALIGFGAAFLVIHGVIGWWMPLQADDWGVSRGAAGGVVGEALGVLVRSTWARVAVSTHASGTIWRSAQ